MRWNRSMNTKAAYEWRRGHAWVCVLPSDGKWQVQIRDPHDDVEFHVKCRTKFAALEFAHIHMRGSR